MTVADLIKKLENRQQDLVVQINTGKGNTCFDIDQEGSEIVFTPIYGPEHNDE